MMSKKSRIRETKHLSTDADSTTATKKLLSIFFLHPSPLPLLPPSPRGGGVLSLVVKEGWPIRGLELIMWPEGQWEASKKITWKGDRQTDIATLWKHRPRGPMLWKYLIFVHFLHFMKKGNNKKTFSRQMLDYSILITYDIGLRQTFFRAALLSQNHLIWDQCPFQCPYGIFLQSTD